MQLSPMHLRPSQTRLKRRVRRRLRLPMQLSPMHLRPSQTRLERRVRRRLRLPMQLSPMHCRRKRQMRRPPCSLPPRKELIQSLLCPPSFSCVTLL